MERQGVGNTRIGITRAFQKRPKPNPLAGQEQETQEETMVNFPLESGKSIVGKGSSAKSWGSKLNPLAREWNPLMDRAPVEDRGLYLTFSHGYPLYEQEISHFFNQKFGRCVEKIFMHRRRRGGITLQCAKVIFRFSHIPSLVLGKEDVAKFVVNAKPMWCKRYKPRNIEN